MLRNRALRPLRRIAAAVSAAMLCFSITADAYGLDPCPHHGVPERSISATQMAMSGHAMSDHAMSHGHATSDKHKSASHDGHHGVCTCSGACDTVVAVAAPQSAGPIFTATVASNVAYYAAAFEDRPSLTLELLPYSIAPPVAHTLV